ncbi:MAG: hypothetical protein QMB51_01525 [Patescibacteria group bacterium]|jgi:hypothetical protein|uniref:hypothetical protein n=1 Tax=Bacteroides graminisolvens TaxID=477666 RepID=UPI001B62E99A|nr:hypothetical protein [Acetoanaerobium sp.]
MKVEIDYDLFDSIKQEEDVIELNYLLNIILYKNRHSVYVTDTRVFKLEVYDSIPKTTQSVIELFFTQNVMTSEEKDCLICFDGASFDDEKKFNLVEGIRYLSQPVSIIVENSFNDSHFFKAIFRCFDDSEIINKHFENLWIQFENSGGCSNIINYIKGRSQFYNDRSKFFRCFVILDSDKLSPNDTNDKYSNVKEFLSLKKIAFHVLEKRMMENYIPDEAINANIHERYNKWKNAYLHLSELQKDYYNIPSGFIKVTSQAGKKTSKRDKKKEIKKNQLDALPEQVKNLYSDLSSSNFESLKSGLSIPNIKSEFPKFFNCEHTVYKKSLLQRTRHQRNPHELSDIVEKIMKLI